MKFLNPAKRGRGSTSSGLLTARIVVAAAALVLAGCSSGSSSGSTESSSGSAAASGGGSKVCVIGGTDAFFAVVKNGADAAGAAVTAAGSEFVWIPLADYDNIGPDMVELTEQAVSQDCTSISLPVWDAAAQDPAIKAAQDKGVNTFLYNSGGEEEVAANNALGYFGTDVYKTGIAMGAYLAGHGATHVAYVNTSPGAMSHDPRWAGIEKGVEDNGGRSEMLVLPPENFSTAEEISRAVQDAIAKDPSIDGLIVSFAAAADAIADALKATGKTDSIQLGSFDVSANILDRISEGTQLVAVDQQGWLQGWLAVSAAWQYDDYAILPATPIILTGPALVTADNIDTVKAGFATGYR